MGGGTELTRPRLTAWMNATIALLALYVVTLLIEVPLGTVLFLIPRRGLRALLGPVAIEAIFVILMVVFIVYGSRGRRWPYVGAAIVGAAHTLLSASIYFRGAGRPALALALYLTLLPAWVAIASLIAVLGFRKREEVA